MQGTRKATGHPHSERGVARPWMGCPWLGKRQAEGAAAGGVLREAVATKRNSIPTTNKSRPLRIDHAEACLDGHPQYSPRRPSLPLRMRTLATVFHWAAPPSRRGANARAPSILQHISPQYHGDHPHPPNSPKPQGFGRWSLPERGPRSENTLQALLRWPRQGKERCRRSGAAPPEIPRGGRSPAGKSVTCCWRCR